MIEMYWAYHSSDNNAVCFFKKVLLNKYLSASTVIIEIVHCCQYYPYSNKLCLIQTCLL